MAVIDDVIQRGKIMPEHDHEQFMENFGKLFAAGIVVCIVGLLYNAYTNEAAYDKGYTEGCTMHDPAAYNYSVVYLNLHHYPPLGEPEYNYYFGYYRGYLERDLAGKKPSNMGYTGASDK